MQASAPPLGLPSPAALLAVLPDIRHQAAPLQAQLQLRRCAELVEDLLSPDQRAFHASSPAGVHWLACRRLDTLIEAAPRLQMALQARGELGFRLGLALLADAAQPTPAECQHAEQVALAVPAGGLGLAAAVVDALPEAWRLPLTDLGAAAESVGEPVLAWAGQPEADPPLRGLHALLAVLPPVLGPGPQSQQLAELIADTLAVSLSRSSLLRVLARESVQRLRDPQRAVDDAFEHLGAAHVLRGRGQFGLGGTVFVQFELLERGQPLPIWVERVQIEVEALLYGECEALAQVAGSVHALLMDEALNHCRWTPWQRLENHQLLSAATQLMHRLSPPAFAQSRQLLELLMTQLPAAAEPWAWLARWHVTAATQGLQAPQEAAAQALWACEQALARDPHSALALSLDAFARSMAGAPLDETGPRHRAALQVGSNEALAWLNAALQLTFEGRNQQACESLAVALALSPLEPWRFQFEDVACHVRLAAGQLDMALQHARRALQARANHAPTLANLAAIQGLRGELGEARLAAERLRTLWPSYSVSRFLSVYPGRATAHAQTLAEGLRRAGLPA